MQKVNGGLLPFHFHKSIVPAGHVEDWNFWKCTVSMLGGEWVRRGCDSSKSLSTFNKQVVGESPPIGVSGRKHQVGINYATFNQVFKHDVKKKKITICLGISIGLPSRTESFGVDQFCWGWKTLGVNHNRRWPVFMDAKLSGCTLGSSTMAVPDKNKWRLQALVQHREMH